MPIQKFNLKVEIGLDLPEHDSEVDLHSLCSSLQDELHTDTLFVDIMDPETGDDEEQEVTIDSLDVSPIT